MVKFFNELEESNIKIQKDEMMIQSQNGFWSPICTMKLHQTTCLMVYQSVNRVFFVSVEENRKIGSLDLMLCANMKEMGMGSQHVLFDQKNKALSSKSVSAVFGLITLKRVAMMIVQDEIGSDWFSLLNPFR